MRLTPGELVIRWNEFGLDLFRTRFGQVRQIEARCQVRFRFRFAFFQVIRFRRRSQFIARWRIQRSMNYLKKGCIKHKNLTQKASSVQ